MSEQDPQNQPDDVLLDLLVKQVTEGLSSAEQRSLEAQDSESASRALRELEQAAAAVTLSAKADGEPLPAALAAKIAAQAQAHFANPAARVSELAAARASREVRPSSGAGNLGWLAAAACLIVAVFGWLRTPPNPITIVEAPPPVQVTPKVATAAEERAALLAQADSLKITLAASKDPAAAGVSGDVVWDPKTQRGFFHFVGLASNDPKVHQYQIWIFDAERDQRYPIDGGVFDIPADSNDVLIPIHAAIEVRKVAAFAVTVEKPGGVVVSAREHVVVLGAAG